MSLDSYKTAFDNAYQEIFQKTLVGLKVANLRFEPVLRYGEAIQRVLPSVSSVQVRTVSRGSDSTIDAITDSTETLYCRIEKEAVFYISDGEVTQTGPLNPGEYFGGKIGKLVSANLDGLILYETVNAASGFDTGDLTTTSSTGISGGSDPITLSSTTVPQMVTRMPAKLMRKYHQVMSNMAFVIDAYIASDIAQYLLGKQFDIVESVFQNGYAGTVSTAEVYVSENLTAEVDFSLLADDVMSANSGASLMNINGVNFRFITGGVSAEGDISVASGAVGTDIQDALAAVLNDPYTSSGTFYYALNAASAGLVAGSSGLCCSASSSVITIRARGGGRLVVSESISGCSFNTPFLHCYYGKKGAIDVVVQDLKPVEMRKTATKRGTNVFSSYLAGIKTFTDGTQKFLDVQIETP